MLRIRVLPVLLGAGVLCLAWGALASRLIHQASRGRLYSDVAAIPPRPVGLVLGCAAKLPDGRRNLYFYYRIQAAAELYRAGKVQYLLVSGDNHAAGYDEPTDMKNSLLQAGVPAD